MSRLGYSVKIFLLVCLVLIPSVGAQIGINKTEPDPSPVPTPPPPKPDPVDYQALYEGLLEDHRDLESRTRAILADNQITFYEYKETIDNRDFITFRPYRPKLSASYLHNPAYGEDSTSLGQFVDNMESLGNITVTVDIVRNSTTNAMELNYSASLSYGYEEVFYREHDYYVGWTPGLIIAIGVNDYVQMSSANAWLGWQHIYFIADRENLEGLYLRWRWQGYYSGAVANPSIGQLYVLDYDWDRTNDADFAETVLAGVQLEYSNIPSFTGWSGWQTVDYQLNNISTGINTNISIAWTLKDAWSSRNTRLQLDWIEINTGPGGTGNLYTINFNDSTPIIVEQTGTQDDYGYINNTGLPFGGSAYSTEGYFITSDYLDYVNGSTLVDMNNASIPGSTEITVQYSEDNSTWVNSAGVPGYETLTDGFSSIDLRGLNYSAGFYKMVNESTSDSSITPSYVQSRLITTEGSGGGGGTTTILDASAMILGLVVGLLMGIGVALGGGKL